MSIKFGLDSSGDSPLGPLGGGLFGGLGQLSEVLGPFGGFLPLLLGLGKGDKGESAEGGPGLPPDPTGTKPLGGQQPAMQPPSAVKGSQTGSSPFKALQGPGFSEPGKSGKEGGYRGFYKGPDWIGRLSGRAPDRLVNQKGEQFQMRGQHPGLDYFSAMAPKEQQFTPEGYLAMLYGLKPNGQSMMPDMNELLQPPTPWQYQGPTFGGG